MFYNEVEYNNNIYDELITTTTLCLWYTHIRRQVNMSHVNQSSGTTTGQSNYWPSSQRHLTTQARLQPGVKQ